MGPVKVGPHRPDPTACSGGENLESWNLGHEPPHQSGAPAEAPSVLVPYFPTITTITRESSCASTSARYSYIPAANQPATSNSKRLLYSTHTHTRTRTKVPITHPSAFPLVKGRELPIPPLISAKKNTRPRTKPTIHAPCLPGETADSTTPEHIALNQYNLFSPPRLQLPPAAPPES